MKPAMGQNLNFELLGARVRTRREAVNMTQKDLASAADCSVTHISNIENHYTIPSLEFIMNLCGILNVTPDYFLLGIDRTEDGDDKLEIQDKLHLCTKEQRHLVSRFLDILVEENQTRQQ